MTVRPNEIEQHRTTDKWLVRFDGNLYWATRSYSKSYPEHLWEVTAIRYAPNGGEYHQNLVDTSPRRQRVIKWLKKEINE